MQWLEKDFYALKIERAVVLNQGVQVFLNKCFAADAVVTTYSQQLQFLAGPCVEPSEDMQKLREECITRNYEILSGDAALGCLSAYSEYFNYEDERWNYWRLDHNDSVFAAIPRAAT